jgi:hypothetical protein
MECLHKTYAVSNIPNEKLHILSSIIKHFKEKILFTFIHFIKNFNNICKQFRFLYLPLLFQTGP